MRESGAQILQQLQMSWTLAEVAEVTGGRILRGDSAMPVPCVATDSRHIQPGALFFALHGPKYDGHRFVGEACERGACGAVVAGDIPFNAPALIAVSDTERALGDLAAHTRRRSS